MKKRTFAFDFDGVVSKYDGVFRGAEQVDEPRTEVIKAIKILKKQGHKILIYSTRSNEVLEKYCKKHKIPFDYLNHNPEYKTGNPGKPVASVYVDDRALCYRGQTAEELVKELNNFQVYYKSDYYKGIVIEESLEDKKIINELEVIGVEVKDWHLYTVLVSEKEIEKLAKVLKQGWYMHFWKARKVIAVFKGKKFEFDYDNKKTWKPVIDYGLSIGIPKEELDFPID